MIDPVDIVISICVYQTKIKSTIESLKSGMAKMKEEKSKQNNEFACLYIIAVRQLNLKSNLNASNLSITQSFNHTIVQSDQSHKHQISNY